MLTQTAEHQELHRTIDTFDQIMAELNAGN